MDLFAQDERVVIRARLERVRAAFSKRAGG